ncbi:MAG TPA: hypothetical protein VHL78_05365 [Actinomycetota bacterium]|nr:hypothetical protein [Actinomycetota bacterium]
MRIRTALLAVLAVAALALTPAASPAAPKPALIAYRGLGAWVDIYDDWSAPEATVAAMADRGVRTLYLQTCNHGCDTALFEPELMAGFIDAAHAAGLRVVGWYLPGYDKPARELRRSLKAINFETATGQRFDSFAFDIEAKLVNPVSRRNDRVLDLAADVRTAVGPSYPLGAITPPYYWDWPFPYAGLAKHVDVFLPMSYTSFRASGAAATRAEIIGNIEAIRDGTGQRNVPIHMIGGIADGLSKRETKAVVRVSREHGLLGASLYDFATSTAEDWAQMGAAPMNPRQSPALPVALGKGGAMGNIPGKDRTHPKEVFYRAGPLKGAWKIRFDGYDVEAGEVALWANWHRVADLPTTPESGWGRRTVRIPGKWLHDGRSNLVAFVADGSFPDWRHWGVRDVELLKG